MFKTICHRLLEVNTKRRSDRNRKGVPDAMGDFERGGKT